MESESNHNLNQGWFTRIHDLLKHVHIQGSETAAAYSTASSASSAKSTASQDVIIDGMTGVQASMVAMTSSLDVIQTAVTDESIPFHLSKLLKLATTTDRAVSSAGVIGEGVERLVKYASKADDEVAGVRTEVFKLCERFAQIEAVVQNMPENTEAELKAIAKSIEVLMMKNGDGGIVSDAQQQHQLQQQSSSTTTTTTPPPLQKQQLADIHRLVESTYSTLISNLPSNSLFGDISSNPFSSTSSSSSPSIEMEQNISQILSLLTEMKNRSFGGGMGMTRSNSNVGSLVNNFENKQQQQLINTTATPSPDLQKMIKQVISHHEELGRRDLETRGALDSIQHTLSILVENSGANASNISNSNHRSSSSDDNNNYSSNVARGERAVVDVSAELGQVKDILSEIREFARAGKEIIERKTERGDTS